MMSIDKVIKTDFRNIKKHFKVILALLIIMDISVWYIHFEAAWFLLLCAILWQTTEIKRVIYFDNFFGEGNTMFQSLPIATEDLIISKCFFGWIADIIANYSLLWFMACSWGMPNMDNNEHEFLKTVLGIFYGFGATIIIPILVTVFGTTLLQQFFRIAENTALYKTGEKKQTKVSFFWTVMHIKTYIILIIVTFISPSAETICTLFVADFAISLVLSIFAVRYTKDVLEGRR